MNAESAILVIAGTDFHAHMLPSGRAWRLTPPGMGPRFLISGYHPARWSCSCSPGATEACPHVLALVAAALIDPEPIGIEAGREVVPLPSGHSWVVRDDSGLHFVDRYAGPWSCSCVLDVPAGCPHVAAVAVALEGRRGACRSTDEPTPCAGCIPVPDADDLDLARWLDEPEPARVS